MDINNGKEMVSGKLSTQKTIDDSSLWTVCLRLTREEHVHELTVGGPATHLLYLHQLGVEAVVHPGQHLVSDKLDVMTAIIK